RGHFAGGARGGTEDRPGDGSLDHAAWRAVLHGKFPGWIVAWEGRRQLYEALRVLPGDAAFSGFAEQAEVSLYGAETRRTLSHNDDLQILHGKIGFRRSTPEHGRRQFHSFKEHRPCACESSLACSRCF